MTAHPAAGPRPSVGFGRCGLSAFSPRATCQTSGSDFRVVDARVRGSKGHPPLIDASRSDAPEAAQKKFERVS